VATKLGTRKDRALSYLQKILLPRRVTFTAELLQRFVRAGPVLHDRSAQEISLYALHFLLWKIAKGLEWNSVKVCLSPNVLLFC